MHSYTHLWYFLFKIDRIYTDLSSFYRLSIAAGCAESAEEWKKIQKSNWVHNITTLHIFKNRGVSIEDLLQGSLTFERVVL